MLKQLTLRGFDEEVAREIERLAQDEGVSLNQSVQELLRRGLGGAEERQQARLVGDSLDHLFGTWSDEEADEFDRAVADFAEIDESMWT